MNNAMNNAMNNDDIREGYGDNRRTCWRCEEDEPVTGGNYCSECTAVILARVNPDNPLCRPTAEIEMDASAKTRGYWVEDHYGRRYWHT
jgi:hypothetical protein